MLTSHVVLTGRTKVGAGNRFSSHVVIGGDPQDVSWSEGDTSVEIGDNNSFREGVTVNRGAEKEDGVTRIGNGNLFMANSHIAHNCRIFNNVILVNGVLLGGHVQATTEQLAEMTQYIEAGKIRVLGVAAEKRVAGMPDIPTLKEQGYALRVGAGRGFMAPAGVPRESAALLEAAFEKVYKSPAWRDYMRRNLYEDVYMNSAELGRHMTELKPEMERFIKELGLANKP